MLMDKRGTETGAFIIRLVLFGLILIVLPTYWVIGSLVDRYLSLVNTYNLEDYMLVHRISYSRNSFFMTDTATGRLYTNVVDADRFSEQVLLELIGNKIGLDVGIKLHLNYNNIDKEIFYNKDAFSAALSRPDIFEVVSFQRIVEVREKGQSFPGRLYIGVSFNKNDK